MEPFDNNKKGHTANSSRPFQQRGPENCVNGFYSKFTVSKT